MGMASGSGESPLGRILGQALKQEGVLTAGERALLIVSGFCPECVGFDDDHVEQTIADHCEEETGHACKMGWYRCDSCGAFGTADNFVAGG